MVAFSIKILELFSRPTRSLPSLSFRLADCEKRVPILRSVKLYASREVRIVLDFELNSSFFHFAFPLIPSHSHGSMLRRLAGMKREAVNVECRLRVPRTQRLIASVTLTIPSKNLLPSSGLLILTMTRTLVRMIREAQSTDGYTVSSDSLQFVAGGPKSFFAISAFFLLLASTGSHQLDRTAELRLIGSIPRTSRRK